MKDNGYTVQLFLFSLKVGIVLLYHKSLSDKWDFHAKIDFTKIKKGVYDGKIEKN